MSSSPNPYPSDHQPEDSFGYSCYAVVLPAPPEIVAKCVPIERASGMTRAKIPAHITVKGTFYGIASLEEVQQRIRAITARTAAFEIRFAGATSYWGETVGWLAVPAPPALQALHDALVAALRPLGTQAYDEDPYEPHLTYAQDVPSGGLARVQEMVAETDFGEGFRAEAIELMGRRGPAYGGKWLVIERFPLLG